MPDHTGSGSEATLADWLNQVAAGLDITGFAPGHTETKLLLDLARDAAHQIERPAAPLTTYLVGVAVGRGASLAEATAQVVALTTPSGD